MIERYLIINADDFGMRRSSNFAVFDLLKSDKITSSTIMAPCSLAPEAVKFAKNNPEAVKSLINKVVAYGKSLGVAMPVFIRN